MKVIPAPATGLLTTVCLLMLTQCLRIETDDLVARPVVEAYLAPGHPITVQISREVLFNDTDTTTALDGLTVRLTINGEELLLESAGNGTYTAGARTAAEGDVFTLQFDYNNETITSATQVPVKPQGFLSSATEFAIQAFTPTPGVPPTFPDPIDLSWNNPEQDYFLVVVHNTEEDPDEINTSSSDRPPFLFRNDPNQGNSYQLRPQQFQYYGRHHVILFRLTAEYAALYQNNGSSSLNIKTPYSNISKGLGIFTGVNSDTVSLTVTKP